MLARATRPKYQRWMDERSGTRMADMGWWQAFPGSRASSVPASKEKVGQAATAAVTTAVSARVMIQRREGRGGGLLLYMSLFPRMVFSFHSPKHVFANHGLIDGIPKADGSLLLLNRHFEGKADGERAKTREACPCPGSFFLFLASEKRGWKEREKTSGVMEVRQLRRLFQDCW